jgi:hypothetical protein
MSGSVKGLSSVLTPFVFALLPLMALLSWASLISPDGPWGPSLPLVPSLPREMPKVKRPFDPSKLTPTVARWPGASVVTLSTMAWAKSRRDLFSVSRTLKTRHRHIFLDRRDLFGPQTGLLVGQTDLFIWLDAFGGGVVWFQKSFFDSLMRLLQ